MDTESSIQTFKLQLNMTEASVIIGRRLHGDGICFANVAFLELILSTPLNRSLPNFKLT